MTKVKILCHTSKVLATPVTTETIAVEMEIIPVVTEQMDTKTTTRYLVSLVLMRRGDFGDQA